ncbi:MAG: AbrB/MazE/SpoVT family DNA-binding domain-containing protein [Legionellales bacterium]|jgi:bifunctional DNA-binding transcriptional regulator/antitoxin component of YhaV-PrlF toxin-antitoxin module
MSLFTEGTMREIHTTIDKAGRIVIPVSYRTALAVQPGAELIMQLHEGEIRLFTIEHAIARAQKIVKKYNKDHLQLSEELIKMRRKEADSE